MLVSAVVPTFNRSDYVGNAIESIQNQTYRNIEIIIVDDGSTDNTADVVKKYAATSGMPIKYVYKSNGGLASSRNKGIEHASGDFVAFLDDDDQWLPDAIKSMVDTLVDTGADFVYTPTLEVSIKGKEEVSLPVAAGEPERLAWKHFFQTGVRACAVLYRSRVFEKLRFDETVRSEDSYLLQQVALTFKAAYSPVTSAKVFQHAGNMSRERSKVFQGVLTCTERILEEFPEFRKELGELAKERLDRINAQIIEHLVWEGNFRDTTKYRTPDSYKYLPIQMKLALAMRSRLPLWARIAAGIFKRFILRKPVD